MWTTIPYFAQSNRRRRCRSWRVSMAGQYSNGKAQVLRRLWLGTHLRRKYPGQEDHPNSRSLQDNAIGWSSRLAVLCSNLQNHSRMHWLMESEMPRNLFGHQRPVHPARGISQRNDSQWHRSHSFVSRTWNRDVDSTRSWSSLPAEEWQVWTDWRQRYSNWIRSSLWR